MCLIYFAINKHPHYRLIVLANRDEFYERASAPAGFWKENELIIGGFDKAVSIQDQLPGTWLGMTKSGKISFVTNYRDIKKIKKDAPSRGQLVTRYLISEYEPVNYLKQIQDSAHLYNGFNLVTGIGDEFYYLSNIQNRIIKLSNGTYGISNHLLDTPWPKLNKGKEAFENKIISGEELNPEALLDLMTDEEKATDPTLPHTGIGIEKERLLSSMFIRSENYGTRNTTLIMIDNSGYVKFIERTYLSHPQNHHTLTFDFKLNG
jgi:uncharacterized protein with NRDE domain